MNKFENAVLLANIVIGAASAWSAWSAHRSARAAEKAAKGNSSALAVAKSSADAARDAADSMGEAIEQFQQQVNISTQRALIDQQRLEIEKQLSLPDVIVSAGGNAYGREPNQWVDKLKIEVRNHGSRSVRFDAIEVGATEGSAKLIPLPDAQIIAPDGLSTVTISRSTLWLKESLGDHKPSGRVRAHLGDGSLHAISITNEVWILDLLVDLIEGRSQSPHSAR